MGKKSLPALSRLGGFWPVQGIRSVLLLSRWWWLCLDAVLSAEEG